MNIILDFAQDRQLLTSITKQISSNNEELNIDNVIKTLKNKFHEIVSKTLETIDRKIALELSSNKNVDLIRLRKKTIKTAYGKFTFWRRCYHYNLIGSEKYFYPLDELLGIRPRTQYTDGCKLEIAFKASELTYRQNGENISKEFIASKSTFYRSIKSIDINQIIPKKIDKNDSVVHLQIDENMSL